jgi:isochorismate pyruvate lyase
MIRTALAFALLLALPALADDSATRPAYWGRPSANGGKCCATLDEVRENIDRIDRDLVRLMAERQSYVGEAGRFKKDPAAVSDPKRVDAVVARVRADAEAQDLDPAVAEKTFRAMIAAFEEYERAEWTKRQTQTPAK